MQSHHRRPGGFLLTLEGPDGSGKSTQSRLLADRLTAEGFACVVTREPGGTRLGEAIRQIVLHSRDLTPVPAADVLLFNAARAQLLAEVISPALQRGEIVICDRFADSTLAYQGYGDGQSLPGLRAVQDFAIGDLRPDLTILFDLPVEEGLDRKRDEDVNRFEEWADVAFHRRVREGFLALAASEPARFVVLDGRKSVPELSEKLYRTVINRLDEANQTEIVSDNPIEPENHSNSSEPERTSMRMDR